jgi:hypothetical protein
MTGVVRWESCIWNYCAHKIKTTRDNGWFVLRLKAFVTDQTLKGY